MDEKYIKKRETKTIAIILVNKHNKVTTTNINPNETLGVALKWHKAQGLVMVKFEYGCTAGV